MLALEQDCLNLILGAGFTLQVDVSLAGGFQKKLKPSLTGGGVKRATSAKFEELQISRTTAKTIAG